MCGKVKLRAQVGGGGALWDHCFADRSDFGSQLRCKWNGNSAGCALTSYERALATTCRLICQVVWALPAFVVALASSLRRFAQTQAFLRRFADGSAACE